MKLLTEKELCQNLSVGRQYIYRQRKKGMPYLKFGNKLNRYEMDDVLQWFKERGNY